MSTKELVLSNIIGINPTGILDFDGTYKLNGTNDIVQNTNTASKESLEKAQTNKIICVENFENVKSIEYNSTQILLLLILVFIIVFIIFYIYFKINLK